MTKSAKVLAATVAGASAIFIGAASYSAGSQEESSTTTTGLQGFIPVAEGQYQGVCAVVTPPNPDPCDAVNGVLRYGVLGAMVNVPYLYKWRVANPGEVTRLNSIMAAPKCSVPTDPQPQIMRTMFGAALAANMEGIACARHPEPIVWPVPNPVLSPTRADKQAPSAPGPVIVTP